MPLMTFADKKKLSTKTKYPFDIRYCYLYGKNSVFFSTLFFSFSLAFSVSISSFYEYDFRRANFIVCVYHN